MVGNYTDYFAESQGGSRKKVEKSFGGGRPSSEPAPVNPPRNRRLPISTNQGFGISEKNCIFKHDMGKNQGEMGKCDLMREK
jgi:hypothetical protein